MKNIYVLEGPDGAGKTTLARHIADITKGSILHCSYNNDINIEEYHNETIQAAKRLSKFGAIIIDRWALSEFIYGTIFRDGPSYDTEKLLNDYKDDITYIYCRNDFATINHLHNKINREELFEDMTEVVRLYDEYMLFTNINWIEYNFDIINQFDFLKGIQNDK